MSVVLVALIVAVGAVVQIHITGRQRRADKREGWERDDLVAARVEQARLQAAEAARLLLERQDAVAAQAREAAALLVENNEAVATAAAETQEQLVVIHDLVNSTLTGVRQSEMVALKAQVVLMRRVMDLNERAGVPATSDELAALEAVEAHAAEVEEIVSDRVAQQEQIDRQSAGE